ncbi:MAG TPA: hypothetical protein VG474_02830 [Solirubrobacteraceae bacterium]|nr:hypothetical protein [Solirubrobacteraceae bacterium]
MSERKDVVERCFEGFRRKDGLDVRFADVDVFTFRERTVSRVESYALPLSATTSA